MLCKYCADIKFKQLRSFSGYNHHKSFKDLKLSASNGCPSCRLIIGGQVHIEGGELTPEWIGSPRDTQITMVRPSGGYIDIKQMARMKQKASPRFESTVLICGDECRFSTSCFFA